MKVLFLCQSGCTHHVGYSWEHRKEKVRNLRGMTRKIKAGVFSSQNRLLHLPHHLSAHLSSDKYYSSSFTTLGKMPVATFSLKDLTSFIHLFPSRTYILLLLFLLCLFICFLSWHQLFSLDLDLGLIYFLSLETG